MCTWHCCRSASALALPSPSHLHLRERLLSFGLLPIARDRFSLFLARLCCLFLWISCLLSVLHTEYFGLTCLRTFAPDYSLCVFGFTVQDYFENTFHTSILHTSLMNRNTNWQSVKHVLHLGPKLEPGQNEVNKENHSRCTFDWENTLKSL